MGTPNTICNKCLTYYPEGTEHVCDPTPVIATELLATQGPVEAPTAHSSLPATPVASATLPVAEAPSTPPVVALDGYTASYYEFPTDAQELIDLIEHKAMGFSQGNIFKAAYRLGEKDGVSIIYDLNKIIFFANRMKAQALKMGATS